MSEDTGITKPGEPKRRLPRWAWVGIIVSLAINLVVVGATVGSFLGHRHGHWSGPRFMSGHHSFYRGLPKERQRELRTLIREAKEPVQLLWKAVREARKKATDAMGAQPLDEAVFVSALQVLSQAEIDARKASDEMILKTVRQLSSEERAWFAKKFMRRWGRHGRHHRRH